MSDVPVEADRPLVPRYDRELGRYVWEDDAQVAPPPVEPAFVREAITALDPDAPNVSVRAPSGVTTFSDVYPRGTKDHATTDAPAPEAEFDPLAEWRVPGEVADDILISLPEGTPKMLRTVLTLLIGAMRRG